MEVGLFPNPRRPGFGVRPRRESLRPLLPQHARHCPVLEAGSAPRFDPVEAGTPLGWASPRRQHAFRLPPGSTAVFYSDGLVENRRRGLDAGLDELVRVAASAPEELGNAPGQLLQYMLDHMLAGHEQDDDVTVLVMHVPLDAGVTDVAAGEYPWATR